MEPMFQKKEDNAMPNGHGPKEYGPHKYADHDGTSDCQFGCGCWMGPARSGGPLGLDPFGKCPKNPTDGNLIGGNADYEHVVTKRIEELERRAYAAEAKLKTVRPSKKKLVEEIKKLQDELFAKTAILDEFKRLAEEIKN